MVFTTEEMLFKRVYSGILLTKYALIFLKYTPYSGLGQNRKKKFANYVVNHQPDLAKSFFFVKRKKIVHAYNKIDTNFPLIKRHQRL